MRAASQQPASHPASHPAASRWLQAALFLQLPLPRTKIEQLMANIRLRVVSWNVDGLDDMLLASRASDACTQLLSTSDVRPLPDVVMLQEVHGNQYMLRDLLLPL